MKFFSFILTGLTLILTSCSLNLQKTYTKDEILSFHDELITIDSHTDTPLRLTREGFDFSMRQDPYKDGTKVDLPRMQEGRMDAVFFAVFLGQRERTEEGFSVAKERAVMIFDSIFSTLERNRDHLELAVNTEDIRRIEKEGKHSILIGVENGYPVGKDPAMVDTFFNLGARYITLCHTRNNDICDSSTDPDGPEFNGLSEFGYKVVERMNELGMMIDVSHISDSAFYDVLSVSSLPVIASHSCARALCDNPRNLDDEMLRALAGNGGVIQMCILSDYVKDPEPFPERDSAKNAVYEKHGNYYDLDEEGREAFLKDWYAVDRIFPPRLATVSDVVDHIDHIVKVAGIDHVGIGTDFDGGGGVKDCYDVSQMPRITEELLTRGYSKKDIRKIWGENFMRVMDANLR